MKMSDFDITPGISQVTCEVCGRYAMPDAPLCVKDGKVVCEGGCTTLHTKTGEQAMPHSEDLVEQIHADLCTIQRTASRAEEQQDTTTLAEIQAVLALAIAQLSSRVFVA